MKKIEVTVNLYTFEELSDTAKEYAISDHRAFLLSEMSPNDFISGDPEYDTPEKLQEQYESEYEYIENNDEGVVESICINDYLFYKSGEIANACTYIEGHPDKSKAGKTIVKYNGVEYVAVDVA